MRHHRRGLRRLLRDDGLLESIEADPFSAGLGPRRAAILDYARTLTLTPGRVDPALLDNLRSVGLGDADILAVCEVVAYYAYVNRIADGLGVQLEPWFRDPDPSPDSTP